MTPEETREMAYLRSRVEYGDRVAKAARRVIRPSATRDDMLALVFAEAAHSDFLHLRPEPLPLPSSKNIKTLRSIDSARRRQRMTGGAA